MFSYKLIILFILSSKEFYCNAKSKSTDKRLLIIAVDGLGKEMLSRFNTPNINVLHHQGSHPRTLMNQYPTNSMPNMFSMATGMYVENHGVVGSRIYDQTLDTILNKTDSRYFQQNKNIKPLWILNEEQGGVSACLQWAGCGFPYNGIKETYSLPFSNNLSFETLADVAIRLLKPKVTTRDSLGQNLPSTEKPKSTAEATRKSTISTTTIPETSYHNIYNSQYSTDTILQLVMEYNNNRTSIQDPANLIMMFFDEPDHTGHLHGTHSDEFKRTIEKLDIGIGYLLEQIRANNLKDEVDIILLSDHGMIDINPKNVIRFSSNVKKEFFTLIDFSPVIHVFPNNGDTLMVYEELRQESEHSNFKVQITGNLPASYHFTHNSRIASIILQADPGYVFEDFEKRHPEANGNISYGCHGYSWNDSNAMLPILLAVGPSFKENVEVPSASNIDVYPLACTILGLDSPDVNGTLWSLQLMLKDRPVTHVIYVYILAFCAILSILGILSAIYCRYIRHQNRHSRLRNDPESLISGYVYSATNNPYRPMSRPSAIMSSEDEFEEEEKLLSREEEWEV